MTKVSVARSQCPAMTAQRCEEHSETHCIPSSCSSELHSLSRPKQKLPCGGQRGAFTNNLLDTRRKDRASVGGTAKKRGGCLHSCENSRGLRGSYTSNRGVTGCALKKALVVGGTEYVVNTNMNVANFRARRTRGPGSSVLQRVRMKGDS